MRIGALIDVDRPLDEVVDEVSGFAEAGLASAWASQIFSYDALTLLAVVGSRVPGISLGTAVVPIWPRHPQMLAQQALTVQAVTGGRLVLGIGLSHKIVVEDMWGYAFDRPAGYMKEYLTALVPMLDGQSVSFQGERLKAVTAGPLSIPGAVPPPVLVAALGPVMLEQAGRSAAGTITWMTGIETVVHHIVPTIKGAAREAGRPDPQVVVGLPVTVTGDPDTARERIDRTFAIYPSLPSYRAMMDREGVERPSAIALVGSAEEVVGRLGDLAQAGTTEFVAAPLGNPEERARTIEVLAAART